MSDDPEVLYGARAIAEFLGLPLKAARHRIDQGIIPTFRMGGTVCGRRSTLRAWLDGQEAAAGRGLYHGLQRAEAVQ